jgi:type I restriction enzyme S subunit
MNETKLNLKFVPLTFIKGKKEIQKQSKNTLVFKYVFEKYGILRELHTLLDKTQYGYTAPAKADGDFKLLRITDINNGYVDWNTVPFCDCVVPQKYLLKPKDIVIARTGNNISYLVNDDVPANILFASYLIRLHCSNELLPEYLYLFLNSYAFWSQILKKQRGALLQNVNAKLMGQLLIPYCDVDTQKKILYSLKENKNDITYSHDLITIKLEKHSKLETEIEKQQSLLKQLRQSVLQEAVEGKLTAEWRKHHPDLVSGENHAARLLEKIKAEKERLVKEGNPSTGLRTRIKKQKPLPPISEDDKPFDLPEGWLWCWLQDITKLITDGKHGDCQNQNNSGYYFLSAKDIQNGKLIFDNARQITQSDFNEVHKRTDLKPGDLCMVNTGATIGKSAITVDNELTCKTTFQKSVAIIKVIKPYIIVQFIQKLLISETSKLLETSRGSAINNLLLGDLKKQLVSLPPLAEQQAIVEKVDRLMGKINALEQQVSDRKEQAEQLMQAVLREAFEGDNNKNNKKNYCF